MNKEEKDLTNKQDKTDISVKKASGKKVVEKDEGLQMMSVSKLDEKKQPKKKNKAYIFNLKVRIVISVLAAIVLLFSAFQLYLIYDEYKRGEEEYANLEEQYTTVNIASEQEQYDGDGEYDENKFKEFQKISVDFDELQSVNSDVVAWIQFEHISGISYPIVKGTDNDYYLNHTFKKAENNAGAIFMDYKNTGEFTETNTIIYGHNMKNGSMFGLMGQYKNEEFYEGREYFWIYTPTADYRYQIFTCYEPLATDSNVYTFWSAPCEGHWEYLQRAKAASRYPMYVDITETDRIVTLSTCTRRGDDYRFVVQGKLVETIVK